MSTIEKDRVCPKCGNRDYEYIAESFSHLDDFLFLNITARNVNVSGVEYFLISESI